MVYTQVFTTFSLYLLPPDLVGAQVGPRPGSAMPDLNTGLELALSALTAIGIGVLIAAQWRARLRAEAQALEARGEQQRQESAARHSPEEGQGWSEEEHYRTPEDQVVNYATFMLDTHGRNLSWNTGIKRMLGYEKGEFIGLPVADLYISEDQADAAPERDLAEAGERGRVSTERWIVRKDGTRFPALVSTASVLDRQGQVVGFAKRLRDITEVRRVEEELGRSKEALDLANEAAGLGTWDHNLVTGELHWDVRAKALFGLSPDAPVTYPGWTGAIHPEDLLTAQEVLERALRDRQPFSTQYRVIWPDGSIHWLAVIGRGSYGPGTGRPLRMRGILLDITERKRTEERLQEVMRLEAIGRLAGGIAHDLNNMLVAILGFSELLAESMGANDPRLDDVRQISEAAARSADLTRQLLAFARRELIQPRKLDLNGIVRYAGGMLRPVLGENVRLVLQLSSTVGAIHADPGRVEQILMNLVLNSRDAMPQGGRVTVETTSVTLESDGQAWQPQSEAPPPGRYAMLAVTDTGHGMDPATLQHIWEPFFTTKPTGKGTGLGLSVVHGSVKQSGGFVWVDSEVGRGTVVRLYWPEVLQEAAQLGELPAPGPAERGKETVLVVEDESVVRALVVRSLIRLGYRCVQAADAGEALRVLEQEEGNVDLVITDVVMPGVSGGDLGLRLAERYPALPVLYTSGFADDDVIRRGLLDATRPFLQKPFNPAELGRKVREVLDSPAVREHRVQNA
jgi:two-component system cell cycle sensor histidine kinase/response regulator CckA